MLDSHKCICGRELKEGTKPFEEILEWQSKTPQCNETDAALHIWKQLDAILREVPENHRDATNHLMQYSDARDMIQRLELRLEAIAEQIGTNERKDAAELDKVRETLEEKQIALSGQQIRQQEELEATEQALGELRRKRQTLENDASIRNSLIRRSQMAREVRDAVTGRVKLYHLWAGQTVPL